MILGLQCLLLTPGNITPQHANMAFAYPLSSKAGALHCVEVCQMLSTSYTYGLGKLQQAKFGCTEFVPAVGMAGIAFDNALAFCDG